MFRRMSHFLMLCVLFSLMHMLYTPSRIQGMDDQEGEVGYEKNFKNVLNINLAAAVVLGATFQRLHIPLNYERVINPDTSIVIGCHPAVPLDSNSSREAFGTSLRVRHYRALEAPRGFWREWGFWGIYQRQKLFKEEQSSLSKAYSDSMVGVLLNFGYKHIISKKNLIIEPFFGIALPVVRISKENTKLWGLPFPWAGLSVGFGF